MDYGDVLSAGLRYRPRNMLGTQSTTFVPAVVVVVAVAAVFVVAVVVVVVLLYFLL